MTGTVRYGTGREYVSNTLRDVAEAARLTDPDCSPDHYVPTPETEPGAILRDRTAAVRSAIRSGVPAGDVAALSDAVDLPLWNVRRALAALGVASPAWDAPTPEPTRPPDARPLAGTRVRPAVLPRPIPVPVPKSVPAPSARRRVGLEARLAAALAGGALDVASAADRIGGACSPRDVSRAVAGRPDLFRVAGQGKLPGRPRIQVLWGLTAAGRKLAAAGLAG